MSLNTGIHNLSREYTYASHDEISIQIEEATRIAAEHGVRVEKLSDFSDFHEACNGLAGVRKCPPIGVFDLDFLSEDAFWIKGTNADGRVVHIQAVQFLDMTNDNLAAYWYRHRLKFCSVGMGYDPDRSIYDTLPAAARITGSVGYHGEIFISPEFRDSGLALPLTRIALGTAYLKEPDYMIGFVVPTVGYAGITARYGYPHAQPNGILWYNAASNSFDNEWLVWADQFDIENVFRLSISREHEYLIRRGRSRH